MTGFAKIGTVVALFALAGCANTQFSGPFSGMGSGSGANGGTASGGFGGAGGAAGGAGAIPVQTISDPLKDPRSTAYFQQTIGDTVLFSVDQSTLTPAAEAVLARQATWLVANPARTAVIEGHADEQGTREYNLALGARRAASVQNFLVRAGVNANRLKVLTFGKERPLAVCSEESCYGQNRRAVTLLGGG